MKRTKDFTKEELAAYERGKKVSLTDMLEKLSPNSGRMFRENVYSSDELSNFANLAISDLQERLIKARKVYRVQVDIINSLNQLTID